MIAALTYVGISTGILVLLIVLYAIEDAKGKRVFLSGFRLWLDTVFASILEKLSGITTFFTHGFMRLLLHYSAHKILKRVLVTLQHLEMKVEHLVRRNRTIAKTIKDEVREKNHLQEIAEHKEEVALSEEEKHELRNR